MSEITRSLVLRFCRGALASAIATMIPLLPQNISEVGNLQQWLVSLSVAGFIGLVTGLILTADKYLRIEQ